MFVYTGPPGQISGFKGENTGLSVQFSWKPPATLAGTSKCCLEYSIKMTNINSGEEKLARNVTSPSLNVTLTDSEKCHAFHIDVISRSEQGWGDSFTTEWSLGGEPLIT